MITLLLVRHGATSWNAQRRLQGRADIPLSDIGREQAEALRSRVAAYQPSVVISSPLTRTRQTAAALGYLDPECDDRWQESDLGEWTGLTKSQLTSNDGDSYLGWRAGRYTPPGAETFGQLRDRTAAALKELLDGAGEISGSALVVTHGGPIRATCAHLLGLEPHHVVPVYPGSLTALRVDSERALLAAYNVTGFAAPFDAPD